jgi:hypothetical protein
VSSAPIKVSLAEPNEVLESASLSVSLSCASGSSAYPSPKSESKFVPKGEETTCGGDGRRMQNGYDAGECVAVEAVLRKESRRASSSVLKRRGSNVSFSITSKARSDGVVGGTKSASKLVLRLRSNIVGLIGVGLPLLSPFPRLTPHHFDAPSKVDKTTFSTDRTSHF